MIKADMKKIATWYSTATSLVTAILYILAGTGIIYAGDIRETGEAPQFIFFLAGSFYIFVGYLVRQERRWLRITLTIINGLIIVIFFQMWAGRPDVLTSTAGLGTKIAQFLLEMGLVYLILNTRRRMSAD